MRALAIALAAIATSCSYGASFRDCEVACRTSTQCPSGFTCDGELCRARGTTQDCASVIGDARLDDPDAPPGTPRCSGTPALCPGLPAMAPCNDQDGCGWTAPTCTNVRDCSVHQMSTQCDADPACFSDVIMPYCKPRASYCAANGSPEPQCESKQYCSYGGGCQGTAAACSAYHDAPSCAGQAGCTWQ